MLVQLCNHELNPIHHGGGQNYPDASKSDVIIRKIEIFQKPLTFRYRLFLSLRSRIRQVLDYSPIDRERELGLDRSETGFIGSYYVSLYHCNLKS